MSIKTDVGAATSHDKRTDPSEWAVSTGGCNDDLEWRETGDAASSRTLPGWDQLSNSRAATTG
ncbi:hypothetical protein LQL77_31170, partial [Rhodococcus cerastii]|nr:hypothetical protein [Rhodococcus cerastii]